MKYFYVTYQWRESNQIGHGDFVCASEFIKIGEFKKNASRLSCVHHSKMHLIITELTKEEFDFNYKEFREKAKAELQ